MVLISYFGHTSLLRAWTYGWQLHEKCSGENGLLQPVKWQFAGAKTDGNLIGSETMTSTAENCTSGKTESDMLCGLGIVNRLQPVLNYHIGWVQKKVGSIHAAQAEAVLFHVANTLVKSLA